MFDECEGHTNGKSVGLRRQREPWATADGAFPGRSSMPKAVSRQGLPPHPHLSRFWGHIPPIRTMDIPQLFLNLTRPPTGQREKGNKSPMFERNQP